MQMQVMYEENQKTQQMTLKLTKWLFDNFGLKLFMQMDVADIDAKLEEVSKRLKEGENRARASEVIQHNSPKKPRA